MNKKNSKFNVVRLQTTRVTDNQIIVQFRQLLRVLKWTDTQVPVR